MIFTVVDLFVANVNIYVTFSSGGKISKCQTQIKQISSTVKVLNLLSDCIVENQDIKGNKLK